MTNRKRGRPSTYSAAKIAVFTAAVLAGRSRHCAAASAGIPYSTLKRWAKDNRAGFGAHYNLLCEVVALNLTSEIDELLSGPLTRASEREINRLMFRVKRLLG